jgi:carbon-monoxide dehydrogenase medium subunit
VTVASYFQPDSLAEALELLSRHASDLLVIAGGTVAMPLINEGISLPTHAMGLRRAGIGTIERVDGELRIGATSTLTMLAEQQHAPLLASAARRTGSWAVRNMATVGGNLFTPPPGGDVATALLALGARVTVSSSRGDRTFALDDFWTGFMTNMLAPDELLTAINVPLAAVPQTFIKFGRREANTPAVVSVAISGGRIALGAVGPHPIRARQAEAVLEAGNLDAAGIDAAAEAAVQECEPFDDAVASAWYRRRMVGLFVKRALGDVAERHLGGSA